MKPYVKMLILDKAEGGAAGGGAPKDPVKSPAEQQAASATPPTQTEGDSEFDELGYPKVTEKDPAAKEKSALEAGDPPKEAPSQKIEDVKDPATGYGAKPPEVGEAPPEPVVVPKEVPVPDDFDKALEGLPKDELVKTKDFMVKNAMTKEQAIAYTSMRKAELVEVAAVGANMQKRAEHQKQTTRAAWDKELRDDPAFGGDKFSLNVARAEKVLTEFLPQTKKMLTENKSMMPPYIMRDLAKLAEHLYSTDNKLVAGEPIVAVADDKVDDGLDFYT